MNRWGPKDPFYQELDRMGRERENKRIFDARAKFFADKEKKGCFAGKEELTEEQQAINFFEAMSDDIENTPAEELYAELSPAEKLEIAETKKRILAKIDKYISGQKDTPPTSESKP